MVENRYKVESLISIETRFQILDRIERGKYCEVIAVKKVEEIKKGEEGKEDEHNKSPRSRSRTLSRCRMMLKTASIPHLRRKTEVRGWQDRELFALKIYDRNRLGDHSRPVGSGVGSDQSVEQRWENEAKILGQLGYHRHIVALHGVYHTPLSSCLLMDMGAGGNALQLLFAGPVPEPVVKNIIQQVASALSFAHSRHIVHRNLKLENFLFETADRRYLFLAGWATAVSIEKSALPGSSPPIEGSLPPQYMAPEVVLGDPIGFPADMWALGIAMYVLLTGEFPFYGEGSHQVKRSILFGVKNPIRDISLSAQQVLDQLLDRHPISRLTAFSLLQTSWILS